jgi:hypothetical protein
MHETQKTLLRRLVGKDTLNFTQLASGYDSEDNIVFHLKQLVNKQLIKKSKSVYFLTPDGLRESGKFDKQNLADRSFKNVFLCFIISKDGKYLLREHKSETGVFYKFPGAKPFFGETMSETRVRLFNEELSILKSNFTPRFVYFGIHFKVQKTSTGQVLFDDAFPFYEVNLDEVDEANIVLKKQNKWFSKEEIKKLEGKWPEIDICLFEGDSARYREYSFVNDYNLKT